MFIVTNRELRRGRKGLAQFGPRPNPRGPNELRLVEVTLAGRDWTVEIIPDVLGPTWRERGQITDQWLRDMGFDPAGRVPGSVYAAKRVLSRVNPRMHGGARSNASGRNLLFFVHGYNSDMHDVVERAAALERNFGVEVITFSWPANGGGIAGTASYLSDKHDAKVSIGALDRALAKLGDMIKRLNRTWADEAAQPACPFTVNLLLHSMGNYLYKHMLLSTASLGTGLIFDNVILAAADVNNHDHAFWVDRINARRRVYITLNENDFALGISRMKLGEEQRARIGQYPFNLNARAATYIDFTDAHHVGDSHTYFEGAPLRNPAVKSFFTAAFNGQCAERTLPFDPATGMYVVSEARRIPSKV